MTLDRSRRRMFPERVRAWLAAAALAVVFVALPPAAAFAQDHAAPAAQGADSHAVAEGASAEGAHGDGPLETIAKLFNFSILVGVLVYFLKSPIAAYLASRGTQIRQDLVAARAMRAAAQAQLAEVEKRLRDLPAELEALRQRGAEDLRAEQARITQAVATERARLVEQTKREIDMRLRVARRDLTQHAAHLAVKIAEQRIRRTITADDQLRLIDRYTSQLEEAR